MDEWIHWLAFARTYPIGEEDRDDALFANLCSVVANAAGVKKKGGGQFEPKDFLLFRMKNFANPLDALRSMFGGKVKKMPGTKRKRKA
jgi:hypothetical protein